MNASMKLIRLRFRRTNKGLTASGTIRSWKRRKCSRCGGSKATGLSSDRLFKATLGVMWRVKSPNRISHGERCLLGMLLCEAARERGISLYA